MNANRIPAATEGRDPCNVLPLRGGPAGRRRNEDRYGPDRIDDRPKEDEGAKQVLGCRHGGFSLYPGYLAQLYVIFWAQ